MPNRILRDWTDSYRVEKLSADEERFFARILMKADDFGRFHADPRLLKAHCFPLIPNIRETDISRWLAACEKAGLIAVYDANGRKYLAIIEFRQRTRQEVAKFPPPHGKPELWKAVRGDGLLTDNCQSNGGQSTARDGGEAGDGDGDVKTSIDVSGEPSAEPPPAVPPVAILEFPCVGKGAKSWALTQAKLDEYAASFPGVNVLSICRQARQWCVDNATKRKTVTGMPAFLTRWLSKEQNKLGDSPKAAQSFRQIEEQERLRKAAANQKAIDEQIARRKKEESALAEKIKGEDGGGPKLTEIFKEARKNALNKPSSPSSLANILGEMKP